MTPVYVVGVVLVVAMILVLGSYNRFVREQQLIDNSWSNVDTELKRRYDLVPNLVQTVKGYAAHERETLEAVTRARSNAIASNGPAAEQAGTENVLVGALRSLFAVSEAYPDLLANQGFTDLQHELTVTENRIQAARRIFNGNVRDLNTRVETVPSNLIARLFGFQRRSYFEIDEAVREAGAPSIRISRP